MKISDQIGLGKVLFRWPIVILIVLLTGCAKYETVTYQQFDSQKRTYILAPGKTIFKISMKITSDTSSPVTLVAGSESIEHFRFELNPSGVIKHDSDWYDSTLDVWFENSESVTGKVTFKYTLGIY